MQISKRDLKVIIENYLYEESDGSDNQFTKIISKISSLLSDSRTGLPDTAIIAASEYPPIKSVLELIHGKIDIQKLERLFPRLLKAIDAGAIATGIVGVVIAMTSLPMAVLKSLEDIGTLEHTLNTRSEDLGGKKLRRKKGYGSEDKPEDGEGVFGGIKSSEVKLLALDFLFSELENKEGTYAFQRVRDLLHGTVQREIFDLRARYRKAGTDMSSSTITDKIKEQLGKVDERHGKLAITFGIVLDLGSALGATGAVKTGAHGVTANDIISITKNITLESSNNN